jgi:hypothetical protein
MFFFLRLLLAHFIGDFPLQFDRVFRLKHKGFLGIIPHATLIIASLAAMACPYLNRLDVWAFILFVGVTHLLQDSLKLNFGSRKFTFWTYLLDQLFHIGIIACVFLTDLQDLQPPQNTSTIVAALYANDKLIVYLIALIVATYNGFFFIRSFKATFRGGMGKYTSFEKWYGMLERGLIVSVFVGGCYLYFAIIPIWLARPFVYRLARTRFKISKRFVVTDVTLSWIVALVTGIILRIILRRVL